MRRAPGVLLLAAAVTACGTTVHVHASAVRDPLGAVSPLSSVPTSASVSVGGTGRAASGVAGATTAVGSGAATTVGPAGSLAAHPLPGVTLKEMRVGITYVAGADKALTALGAGGAALGDTKAVFQLMIDHINQTGGLAGRRVIPVWFAYQALGDRESQHQAACAAFTQDDHVVFATGLTLSFGPTGNTLVPCLAKKGTMWLGIPNGDDEFWSTYHQTLFSPDALSETRELSNLVDSAAAQGFFAVGAKVGLIQVDSPEIIRAVDRGLRPAMARHGVALAQVATVPSDNSFPAAVSSSVLRFASAGVTNVLFAAPGGGGPDYFMTAANSQHYKPRYALSSWDVPSVVQALAPADQLRGTVGQGYSPVVDVDAARDPGLSAAATQCLNIYRAARVDTSSRLTVGTMFLACDTFLFARSGFARMSSSAPAFEAAVDLIGTTFAPAGTFSNRFTAATHDGIGSYRYLAFADDCRCFRYVGGLRSMQ